MYYCYQELSEKEQTAEKEDRYTGTVTWKVYFKFWKAGAGIPMLLVLIILTLGTQVNGGYLVDMAKYYVQLRCYRVHQWICQNCHNK